jgi:hypothetical protein
MPPFPVENRVFKTLAGPGACDTTEAPMEQAMLFGRRVIIIFRERILSGHLAWDMFKYILGLP